MQKNKFYLFLAIIIFVSSCKNKSFTNENNSTSRNIEIKECVGMDENKIFNDEKWFLPYTDIGMRDPKREVFEQWKHSLDNDCLITLTLYKDSSYVYDSPCEWDFPFTGYYKYICDTLYCVQIDIDDHSISDNNPPKVIGLEKYIVQGKSLKYLLRMEPVGNGEFHIQEATNDLCFEKDSLI